MATLLKSKNITQSYLQDWLNDVVTPEAWTKMESVDVFGAIEDELLGKCNYELQCHNKQENMVKTYYIKYNLDFSEHRDFIYDAFEVERACFEREYDLIKHKQYYLCHYINSHLDSVQGRLFYECVDERAKKWIDLYDKSTARTREDLAEREIKLFDNLFAGNISPHQERISNEHFQIADWIDVYIKYERLLRGKSPRASMNIHNTENCLIVSVIDKYVALLKSRLNYKYSNQGQFNTQLKKTAYLNDFSKSLSHPTKIEGSIMLPPPEKKTSPLTKLQWSEKTAQIADQQLDKLYSSLTNPTGWNKPFIDCPREVFREVMKGNSEMKITWISEQTHLVWLVMVLMNNELFEYTIEYHVATVKSFHWNKGIITPDKLKITKNALMSKAKIDRPPYTLLTDIACTLTIPHLK